ncbi:hypothetical protein [Streptomyces mirabilis]|uniref:hypothetical protein n=1 Tax=Streptomyces mirabilis TaxID=68239 RepID=UPI0036758822
MALDHHHHLGVRYMETVTTSGTWAPLPGSTRQEMFEWLYDRTVRGGAIGRRRRG